MTDKIKHLVSKKKKRFIEDGFDLDLAYIKPNIIAMGFPSEKLEGVYRNHLDDVHRFLELKHKDKYKVYNLCSEKNYDPQKFGNRVSQFGFDDHNAPPFELILPCCYDMEKWLDADEKNVAIVHCKAGKGRTGVMICAYLLYKKHFTHAIEAMNYYADARTENKKGVTIPSQRRYIAYFGYFARHNNEYVPKTILLNSVTFIGTPTINSGACSPSLIICQQKVILQKSKSVEVRKNQDEVVMDIGTSPIPICGDIKIDVFHKDYFKKERMFVFWFNTYFLERGVTSNHPNGGGIKDLGLDEQGNHVKEYVIPKKHLDKANKDKKHKLFPETFTVRLNITIPKSHDKANEVRVNSPSGSMRNRGPPPPIREKPSFRDRIGKTDTMTPSSRDDHRLGRDQTDLNNGEKIQSTGLGSHRFSPKFSHNRNEKSTFYYTENEPSRVVSDSDVRKKKYLQPEVPLVTQQFSRVHIDPPQKRWSRSIEHMQELLKEGDSGDSDDDTDDEEVPDVRGVEVRHRKNSTDDDTEEMTI